MTLKILLMAIVFIGLFLIAIGMLLQVIVKYKEWPIRMMVLGLCVDVAALFVFLFFQAIEIDLSTITI